MAKFEIADKITGINEGGYAHDPDDRGGETFCGIARYFWPGWLGWKYIDRYKNDYVLARKNGRHKGMTLAQWINASAKVVTEPTMNLVKHFYKVNFWELNRLGEIKCQQLANTVYDFGVNSGKGRAARFLQEVIGGLDVDGKIGERTIKAANSKECRSLYSDYNSKREEYYKSIAKGSQAKYLKSWLRRLLPFDKQ